MAHASTPAPAQATQPQTQRRRARVRPVGRFLARGLGVLAALALAAMAIAYFAGYRAMVVTSGSMEPTLATGQLVITKSVSPTEAQPGDVIAFHDPAREGALTIHRAELAAPSARLPGQVDFRTRGDANTATESWSVAADGEIGSLVAKLPVVPFGSQLLVGRTLALILMIVALAIAAVILFDFIWRRPVPRRAQLTGATLAALLLLSAATVGYAAAAFTSAAQTQGATLTAGTVNLTNDSASATLLPPQPMVPGDTYSRCFGIRNSGSLGGDLTVTASASGTLGDALTAQIRRGGQITASSNGTCGGVESGSTQIFNGTVSTLGSLDNQVAVTSGATVVYKFTITLPSGTSSSYSATSAQAAVTWEVVR